MVDPAQVTNYGMNQEQLEEFLLFAIAVAGHNADSTAKALQFMLDTIGYNCPEKGPFGKINWVLSQPNNRRYETPNYIFENGDFSLFEYVMHSGLGCHMKTTFGFKQIANSGFNLRTVTPAQLETIHGIGPKTARFFVLHTQENTRYAVLDTHILKWLRTKGYLAPKTTPIGRRYAELEKMFLKEADIMGTNPAELDLAIWNFYHKSPKITIPVRD